LVSPILSTFSALVVSLGIAPRGDVARETVDLIEVNHFYDEQGRLVFDQVIFYDWSKDDARYMVRAWRLVKNPAQVPQRDWKDGGYVAVWQDGELMRHVRAASIRETWTQYDPELVEREYLPKERRKELMAVKVSRSQPANLASRSAPQPQPPTTPSTPSAPAVNTAAVAAP
jgi:hypothetical protein